MAQLLAWLPWRLRQHQKRVQVHQESTIGDNSEAPLRNRVAPACIFTLMAIAILVVTGISQEALFISEATHQLPTYDQFPLQRQAIPPPSTWFVGDHTDGDVATERDQKNSRDLEYRQQEILSSAEPIFSRQSKEKTTLEKGQRLPQSKTNMEEVCTQESGWMSNHDIIHIAVTLDANYFEKVFPSWINALSKSNPDEPLVLYILTVELSEKQRCLLRLMASKLLPNARIFTIPTVVEEFKESFHRRPRNVKLDYVSVATQSRLRITSILPCVDKVLWIDLDAFVVSSLRKLWDEPVGTCGIAARSEKVDYMARQQNYEPSLEYWHDQYGKSFNAGVMVIDLKRLRQLQFEETIVSYWAVILGVNDQVTFNIACNSTHGELNPSLNVFQYTEPEETPNRSDWVIAHFQGHKKPWSGKFKRKFWNSGDFWQIWEEHATSFEEVLDL